MHRYNHSLFQCPCLGRLYLRKYAHGYICFMAATFQFSGGLYIGTLNQMMGKTALMREDLLMCLYANLAGMAIYFPLLFRMKFRFTNKSLLLASAAGVLLCNMIAPHVTFLPFVVVYLFCGGYMQDSRNF